VSANPQISQDAEAILETVIYLYTESRRTTKALARTAQLTGPQLTVLKGLEHIGRLSLTELSERVRAQNSTVTGIIDRMEREGLVTRERSTEDRRVVQIGLTEKGATIAKSLPVAPMEVFRDALATLSAAEMQDLLRVLTKVASRVRLNLQVRAS
jgi:MarR family transcriptional regulator, organic hydroperoxide resistance regulator